MDLSRISAFFHSDLIHRMKHQTGKTGYAFLHNSNAETYADSRRNRFNFRATVD